MTSQAINVAKQTHICANIDFPLKRWLHGIAALYHCHLLSLGFNRRTAKPAIYVVISLPPHFYHHTTPYKTSHRPKSLVIEQNTSSVYTLRSSLNTITLPVLPHSLQRASSIPHPHRTGLHSIHPPQPQSWGSWASGHSASCVLLILNNLSGPSRSHAHICTHTCPQRIVKANRYLSRTCWTHYLPCESAEATSQVVSASDVTPTERWLNVWCIWYTYLETLQECRSCRGFPGDVCVAFFNVLPGNKNTVAPNPFTKEESCRAYNCDDKCLSGSNKRWIFKSMWNI